MRRVRRVSIVTPATLLALGALCPAAAGQRNQPMGPTDPDSLAPEIWLAAPLGQVTVQYPLISIRWCDNQSLYGPSRSIRVNGIDKTASFTYVTATGGDCIGANMKSETTTVPLNMGANTISASICDNWNNCASENFTVYRVAPGKPGVVLRHHNGDHRDRSLCLTSGAGEAAAWQCGDLLVSHGLPGYATMGRARSLTLLYNSAQAVPKPTVVAWVNRPAAVQTADSIYAELRVNGLVRSSAWYYPIGSTAQIALAYDASTDSSGVYPFTLLVRHQYASGVYDSTLADTVLVVNRSQNRFGAGWHLAGVEELRLNQPGNKILWVGGDGSAKVYRNVATNTWLAALGALRDTLRYDPGTLTYTRTLRHGIQVKFDVDGRHVETIDRAGQKSVFTWTGSPLRLTGVQVPPQGVSGTTYALLYDAAGKLDRIVDPANRVLDATVVSGRLTSLLDPDNYVTGFAYDGVGRMTGRTTRRGATTAFAYAKGLRVTQVKVPLDPSRGDTAVTQFEPWDEQGLAFGSGKQLAWDTTTSRTRILGPRLGVDDNASFWVDRWGAPVKMVDPEGATTTIVRGDATVPARETKVTAPNGAITTMAWDARGNVLQARDSTSHLADGLPTAVTRWTYNALNTRDAPDTVIDSTATGALVTRYAYNTWGLTDSVIDEGGHVTRFEYITGGADPLKGLLRAVVERSVPVWNPASLAEAPADLRTAFGFNTLGNVVSDTAPDGHLRQFARDGLQRVTAFTDPAGHLVELTYDALNRPLSRTQHVEGDVLLVTQQYYTIDVVDSVLDPRRVVRRFEYDTAGRMVREIDDYGKIEQYYYNRAGLVDSIRPRFFQDSVGRVIRHVYSPGGRVVRTAWPARDVATDSIVYTYDVLLGEVVTATSASRKVARTYYATGAVKSEVQSAADGSGPYTNLYGYDRVGRRTWYRAGSAAANDSIWYSYAPTTGDLTAVGVRWSSGVRDSVRFWWDALGRRDTVLYTNQAKLKFAYDAHGALRLMCADHPGGPPSGIPDVFDLTLYVAQTDADGMVQSLRANNTVPGQGDIPGCGDNSTMNWVQTNSFDVRHQLLTQQVLGRSPAYTYDSSGNVIRIQDGTLVDNTFTIPAFHNRIAQMNDLTEPNNYRKIMRYDGEGARQADSAACTGCDQNITFLRYYYYDGLGRTSGVRTRVGFNQWVGSSNSCRYDPLGRLYAPCAVEGVAPKPGYDDENVTRTQPDGASFAWTFVHGPGTDDPLMGYYRSNAPENDRYWYYVSDGQGRQYAVGDQTGYDFSTHTDYVNNGGKFAGGITNAHTFAAARYTHSALEGLAFFRNRFYDQESGRWTQEDPIGFGGGFNLYAYVGNNPVSFVDPFGLEHCGLEEHGPGPIEPCPYELPPVVVEGEVDPWGGRGLFDDDPAREAQESKLEEWAKCVINYPGAELALGAATGGVATALLGSHALAEAGPLDRRAGFTRIAPSGREVPTAGRAARLANARNTRLFGLGARAVGGLVAAFGVGYLIGASGVCGFSL